MISSQLSTQPTYFVHTFGCQSNKSDSERIAGDYEARGYAEASDWRLCDELVVNTASLFFKGKNPGYSKSFQLGLHTLTPVIIVAYVLETLGYTWFHGFLYFVAFAVWTLVMISKLGASGRVIAAPVASSKKPATKRTSTTRKK